MKSLTSSTRVASAALLLGLLAQPASAQAPEPVPEPLPQPAIDPASAPNARTYALIVASNRGGPGQEALRYAEADARKVAEVLTSVGGFDPSRVQSLLEPSVAAVRGALTTLKAQLAADAQAGEQSMVFLYYSGHARADALNLGADSMPLAELRERVTALPATLSIVVLDACQSGAFSRVKGAAPASDFSFNSVQRLNTEGIAVMASSSALELSQESDELESSYFTHHLLVGLRGGGDANRDGRVTLSEAYSYAYNHTLAQTAATSVGEQHVTLETDFRGKGDVPLTYPAQARSRLLIPASFGGKLLLQKLPSWAVLAELQKVAGEPIELALPPGDYAATVRRSGGAERCTLRIEDGTTSALDLSGCKPLVDDKTRAKGADPRAPATDPGDEGFVFEALVGLGSRHRGDAYDGRLGTFGFERESHTVGRYSFGVGRRLHDHLLVGLTFSNLDSAEYLRHYGITQRFEWESYAAGAFVQGDIAFGAPRLFSAFARAGGGLTYGFSTFDAVEREAPFADANPAFEDTTASTREVEDSFTGYHAWLGLGVTLSPLENFGFQLEGRYVLSPTLDNDTGETHDVGGFSCLFGARLRTWE